MASFSVSVPSLLWGTWSLSLGICSSVCRPPFLLTDLFLSFPSCTSMRLWPAVAGQLGMTLQLGPTQLNDSAPLSLFQILGRVSDQLSLSQMSTLGSVTETGGAQSHGNSAVPPRVLSGAASKVECGLGEGNVCHLRDKTGSGRGTLSCIKKKALDLQ